MAFSPELKRPREKAEASVDGRFKKRERLAMRRIPKSLGYWVGQLFGNFAQGEIVGVEVAFIARDDVSTLPGLRVFHSRKNVFDVAQAFTGFADGFGPLLEFVPVPPVEHEDHKKRCEGKDK